MWSLTWFDRVLSPGIETFDAVGGNLLCSCQYIDQAVLPSKLILRIRLKGTQIVLFWMRTNTTALVPEVSISRRHTDPWTPLGPGRVASN